MRKIIIITFLLIRASSLQSQVSDSMVKLRLKARQLSGEGAYAEAIVIYSQLITATDSCLRRRYYEEIADWYKATGNIGMAADAIRKSIASICRPYPAVDSRTYWSILHRKQEQIGDLLFEMKKYDSALYYFRLSCISGNSKPYYNTGIAYKLFLCYNQMKQWDSAFAVFTPFALDSTAWLVDDSSYQAMIKGYYNFLCSKYSKKKIRYSFTDGYNKVIYSYRIEKDTVLSGRISFTYRDKAILQFLGQEFNLNLYSGGIGFEPDKDDEKEFAERYRQHYLKGLYSSYLFKIIMLAK